MNWYKTYKTAAVGDRINPSSLTPEILNFITKRMKSKGYDWKNPQDTLQMLQKRDYKIITEDLDQTYQEALQSVKSRKFNLKEKNTQRKELAPNVNFQRIKELGYTNNMNEAGFIAPDGKLIDLSGRKEGGEGNRRELDHREAGGTIGMQELMSIGYIRLGLAGGMIDMKKAPTPQQIHQLERAIITCHQKNTPITLDLDNGIGEKTSDNQYYRRTNNYKNMQFELSDQPEKIIEFIERYYGLL